MEWTRTIVSIGIAFIILVTYFYLKYRKKLKEENYTEVDLDDTK